MHIAFLPIISSFEDPFLPFTQSWWSYQLQWLSFHPRGKHMSILAKALPRTLQLKLVRPSQWMQTSSFEPLDPATPEGRYILSFTVHVQPLISYWLKHVWVGYLTLAAERVQTNRCTHTTETETPRCSHSLDLRQVSHDLTGASKLFTWRVR